MPNIEKEIFYFFAELKGNSQNLYDAGHYKWTKCFRKYASFLDILLGVCKFTGNTAQLSSISNKIAYFKNNLQ